MSVQSTAAEHLNEFYSDLHGPYLATPPFLTATLYLDPFAEDNQYRQIENFLMGLYHKGLKPVAVWVHNRFDGWVLQVRLVE
jgi:hypothetical protein